MFSTTAGYDVQITARLGHNPRYRGSFHDPDTARQLGYRGALIPGAFLYGYMSRLAVEAWGMQWIERGSIEARFRKPVYDGEALLLRCAPLRLEDDVQTVAMSVLDSGGQEVASGGIGLPEQAFEMPDLAAYPILPRGSDVEPVGPGELVEGFRLLTRNEEVTAEAHAQSLADFGETYAGYREQGIVHAGLLLRTCIGDANSSRRYPTPVILVAAAAQHLGVAHVRDRLAMSGKVTRSYERKGHHYFDSDELLIANRQRPIGYFRRTSIYAARLAA